MRKPLLIALNSPAPQSGKSSVAKRLVEYHGFDLMKFASPLKDMLRTLLHKHCGIDTGMVERYIEGDLKEAVIPELDVTPRRLMITLGTEWGRDQVRRDVWIHIMRGGVERCLSRGISVVIDDMRFLNEMAMVTELGGSCFRVLRHSAILGYKHRSEGELDSLAIPAILNNATMVDLCLDVDRLVASFHAS